MDRAGYMIPKKSKVARELRYVVSRPDRAMKIYGAIARKMEPDQMSAWRDNSIVEKAQRPSCQVAKGNLSDRVLRLQRATSWGFLTQEQERS